MSLWRLTDTLAWCNADELGRLPAGTRCVLGVGRNMENLPLAATPLAVPETIPYLSAAWPDSEQPPEDYWSTLRALVHLIVQRRLFPCVVHCRAGQMRSPAVTAWLAAYQEHPGMAPLRLPFWLDRCRALRPDICYQAGAMKPFVRGMLNYLGTEWK